jgi:crotonobetainyl-CoA:carnitine CoA-transferase CaiB-like acyl-CoA transferase
MFFSSYYRGEKTARKQRVTNANGSFVEVDHPTGQYIQMVATPVGFRSTPAQTKTTAPEVGQHTEEVLLAAGYSWEDMTKLSEQEVIL